uniref:uncharacterized protein LOC122758369 n=1 Tax=Solea senegalensis TaxID=28829 RepID=UPI001CD8ED4C|nr:uncharacterized protein LOC122758369 [Solea senegalensis]
MAAIGGLCFDEDTESFHTYEQRFAQFVEACEIPQGKQGAVFLTVVGAKTVALLGDLLAPRTPSECSLDVILNALRGVLKKNVLRERYTFRARKQQRGESLSEYVDALKGLSATCEFGEQVEEHLRDQLVYGIRSEELRTKLFVAACGEQLEWDKVVDIVNNFESTTRSLITSSDSESSSKGKQGRKRKPSVSGENVCTTEGHAADTCEYEESQCNKKQLAERTCGNTSTEDAANHGQPTAESVSASPGTTVLTGPRFRRIHVVIPRSTALQLSRDQKFKTEDDKDYSNLHTSIFKSNSPPQVTRCTVCCSHFHCPLCATDIYKPRCRAKVQKHFELHIKNAVHHKDFCITKCHQACRGGSGNSGHFHCPFCIKTVIRRQDAIRHLEICLQDLNSDQLPTLEEEKHAATPAQHFVAPVQQSLAPAQHPEAPARLPEAPPQVPTQDPTVHITIQRGKSLPTLQRCTRCCDRYHCPFCLPSFFQPAQLNKVRTHLMNHFTRAIVHEGYNIHRCGLDCRPQLHYHCLYCNLTPFRKVDFVKHLSVCKKKRSAITPDSSTSTTSSSPPLTTPVSPPPDPEGTPIPAPATPQPKKGHAKPVQHKHCPICKLLVNKKNLKKHIERRHTSKREDITAAFHLQSESVDQEIYIDKSFFDPSTHVQKKVCGERQHVSCELSQCQVEMELACSAVI